MNNRFFALFKSEEANSFMRIYSDHEDNMTARDPTAQHDKAFRPLEVAPFFLVYSTTWKKRQRQSNGSSGTHRQLY